MRQLYSSNYTGIPAYLMDFGFGELMVHGEMMVQYLWFKVFVKVIG